MPDDPSQPTPATQGAVIVGIDPGASGAIAIVDLSGSLIAIHDMPVVEVLVNRKHRKRIVAAAIAAVLRDYTIQHVYLERVGARPGEAPASSFSFGIACGLVEGVVAALGLPHTLVTPQQWKKVAGIGPDKGQARQRAMQIWPGQAGSFTRVRDDGRAEACLIARHALLGLRGC